jgi:hypothetical protein
MKAYMSETRRGALDPVGIARTYSNVGRDVVEARAILAATEPTDCRAYGMLSRERQSLAESLAAILPVLDALEAEASRVKCRACGRVHCTTHPFGGF